MPLMIKLNRNVVRVYLCLDNGHFITVFIRIFWAFRKLREVGNGKNNENFKLLKREERKRNKRNQVQSLAFNKKIIYTYM